MSGSQLDLAYQNSLHKDNRLFNTKRKKKGVITYIICMENSFETLYCESKNNNGADRIIYIIRFITIEVID